MAKRRNITTRGIIYLDGKLFSQKLKSGSGSREYWCTPGGKLDPNESLIDGLHREMIEETGIAPEIGRLLFIQQFSDDEMESLEFFFHITNPADYHTIDLDATSHGLLEIAECEFIDPTTQYILPKFLSEIDLTDYTAHDKPVLIKYYS